MIEINLVNPKLIKLVSGHKILFVDGIRHDQLSGGRTSTKNILYSLNINCHLFCFSTSPSGGIVSRFLYSIAVFPANIFAILKIYFPNIWGEFFLRFSPIISIIFLFKYMWCRPEFIIFNHHSTFYLSRFAKSSRNIYIWHDVPSLKKIALDFESNRFNKKACALIQKRFIHKGYGEHFVFSFTDKKFLKRFYGVTSHLLPIFFKKPPRIERKVQANCWLLVGNWYRNENRDGAKQLFREYCALVIKTTQNPAKFNVAGSGADLFMLDLLMQHPELQCIEYVAHPAYSQLDSFQDIALLAPVLSGAGIKVKTIEAWTFGIPVIGTSQAFSGIPASIWRLGGIKMQSLADMAKVCFDANKIQEQIIELKPQNAYIGYQSAIND